MVKAGLDMALPGHHGMHSLRSTLAKNMLDSGAPLPVISETLGLKPETAYVTDPQSQPGDHQ